MKKKLNIFLLVTILIAACGAEQGPGELELRSLRTFQEELEECRRHATHDFCGMGEKSAVSYIQTQGMLTPECQDALKASEIATATAMFKKYKNIKMEQMTSGMQRDSETAEKHYRNQAEAICKASKRD